MIMPLLRAVITDVDGTLFPFGESPKVSAGNIAALQRAIDSGVHVGLATGRIPGPWRDRIRTQLPGLGASVFANGALVLSENDEIIHENTMPAAAVEAVEAFTRGGTAGDPAAGRICVLATTRWEAAGDAYDSLRYVELSPQGEESWVTRLIRSAGEPEIVLLPSLQPLLDRRVLKFVLCACSSISNLPPCRTSSLADSLLSLSCCCLLLCPGSNSPNEPGWCDMPQVVSELRTALAGTGASVLDCGPRQCEILPPGCHKGAGVKRLLERLDIPPESVLACGDAENDVEMLCMVGVGVAMGNAKPPAVEAADHVVATNDEDGVAESVRRFVFGERDSE